MKKCTVFHTALIIFTITLSEGAFSQQDSVDISKEWNGGFIQLSDKSLRHGFIQYNHTRRLIRFKGNLNDGEELSFQEKRVLAMEYFDAAESKKRRFYTLNVKEEDSGFVGAVLFEIIMEMKAFAVVSRLYPASRVGKGSSQNNNLLERIYVVDHKGNVELLSTLPVVRIGKSKPVARQVEPFLDQVVLKKFVGPKWKMVKAHVKEKRLHLKRKADLINALEFYHRLELAE